MFGKVLLGVFMLFATIFVVGCILSIFWLGFEALKLLVKLMVPILLLIMVVGIVLGLIDMLG